MAEKKKMGAGLVLSVITALVTVAGLVHLMSYYRKGDKTLLVLGNFQKEPQSAVLPSAYKKVLLNNYPEVSVSGNTVTLDNYQVLILEL